MSVMLPVMAPCAEIDVPCVQKFAPDIIMMSVWHVLVAAAGADRCKSDFLD